MSEYSSIPSTGKLKLKGVKDSRVDKKKKKKKLPSADRAEAQGVSTDAYKADTSVMLQKSEDEDRQIAKAKIQSIRDADHDVDDDDGHDRNEDDQNVDLNKHLKTEAERRYEEQRRKRLEKRLEREGVKTHKQRVEDLNKYLSNLSEHHDMPKIGPG